MCCLLIILEYSDEDGAEGWIAPASHHRGTFPWLSGRCFVFYSLEIKLCNTLLCLKLNSAILCSPGNWTLLCWKLDSPHFFTSVQHLGLSWQTTRELAVSAPSQGLAYQKSLDVQLYIPVFNMISSADLFCRPTSHSVCLNSFALLHKNCVVYRPTCQ